VYNLIFSWFALVSSLFFLCHDVSHANQGNYYIAFIILSKALEGYVPQISILNLILNYFYLGLLIMCFLLSLGNRPQGSKWGYTLAFVGFGFVTIYMTVAAFLLAYKGIQSVAQAEGRAIQVSDFFTNSIFTDVVLSLAATLGLYIVASLIFVSRLLCVFVLLMVDGHSSSSRGI
jgi:chitin synthase